ncbi:hypothetical protein ACFZC3_18370 [Streptomyces sp. NPDC007903]|uniref:hypothetical protein n=1 Tax=Streptomyces sp. NPDC007903 TaxID=3364786 RepID=UPI0036EBFFD1
MTAVPESYEDGLRRLLNEWDPLDVAEDVQDEYDCMVGHLLLLLRTGSDQARIAGFLRTDLTDHFGLDPRFLGTESMAARLVAWWGAAAPHAGA